MLKCPAHKRQRRQNSGRHVLGVVSIPARVVGEASHPVSSLVLVFASLLTIIVDHCYSYGHDALADETRTLGTYALPSTL